jgi:hypothetical protein
VRGKHSRQIDAAVERTTLSQAEHSIECWLAKMTLASVVGQIREKTH